jgi:single-stranded DNA-specific DHH superfamily exonuclease
MKYMKEAVEFLNNIKKTDEILIVFNNDGDGICSCSLVMKFLEITGRKKPYIISQPMPMDKNIINKIKSTFPQKIIFLDLVVDQQEDIVKKIRGFADILIIDHHKIQKNLNGRTIVHYNPRFTKKDAYQSTSYCVYKIISQLVDVKDVLWIAAVGMISDYNLEGSKDLETEAKKSYDIGTPLYESFLGRLSDMIAATRATKLMSCEEMVHLFLKIKDPKNLENTKDTDKLIQSYKEIENEKISIMADANKNTNITKNLVLYEIKSKFNLDALISTMLSENYRNKLVLVYSKSGNRYKVSARNQDKNIDAARIMKNAVAGLKGSGGGHEAAAGAVVDAKDWDKFLEHVKELVE